MTRERHLVLEGISEIATPVPGAVGELVRIADGAIWIEGELIRWLGPRAEAPPLPERARRLDLGGRAVVPGFVDAHTHLLFAGRRHDDFAARCRGVSYEERARSGGGILYTVRQTRAAADEHLLALGRRRLQAMAAHGTTTVEAKSGYGLSHEHELRLLRLLGELDAAQPLDVVRTYLGAHETPPEGDRQAYLEEMIERTLPEVSRRGLATFVDAFCERGVYGVAEVEGLLRRGRELGVELTLHAEQLHHLGGARLAAGLGARSVSHLEQARDDDLEALAAAGTVALLLPACPFFLGRGPYPPARRAIELGVPIALATDFNPGSAMTYDMPLVMTIACTQMGLTPEEALWAATLGGARALGLHDRGSLRPGALADLLVVDSPFWLDLVYHFGENHVQALVKRGELVLHRGGLDGHHVEAL